MSDADLIGEVARDLLAADVAKGGDDPWRPVREAGWLGIGVPEEAGGLGGSLREAVRVARAVGETAAPTAATEAVAALMLAGTATAPRKLVETLIDPERRVTLLLDLPLERATVRDGMVVELDLTGRTVPFGSACSDVAVLIETSDDELGLAVVPAEELPITAVTTVAGLRYGEVGPMDEPLPVGLHRLAATREEALAGVALMSAARLNGAAATVHRLSHEYVDQRRQFGRSIGSFQVVAHAIARQAGQIELTGAAFEQALAAAARGSWAGAYAARALAGTAAPEVAAIAHQVHGAIGVTEEHDLHRFTMRLQSWRFELGTTRQWQRAYGAAVLEAGPRWWDRLDPMVVEAA